jgi:uncharacterized membrane protein YidH (DUF202 family)
MAPSRDLEGLPPSLAKERTELAWTRTVIAFAAVGGAILKANIAAGLTVIALALLIWGVVRAPGRRRRRVTRRQPRDTASRAGSTGDPRTASLPPRTRFSRD